MTGLHLSRLGLALVILVALVQGFVIGLVVGYQLNYLLRIVLIMESVLAISALVMLPDILHAWQKYRSVSGSADAKLKAECQPIVQEDLGDSAS